MQMDQLRYKYEAEHYYRKASAVTANLTDQDFKDWYEHDCTKSLLLTLEGDLSGIVSLWLNGGYSDMNSVEATAQLAGKGLGSAQAIEDVIQHIRNLKEMNNPTEDSYENEFKYSS